MGWFVYILKCADDSYYVGMTQDVVKRVHAHQEGSCRHTSPRRPVVLCYAEDCSSREAAEKRERQIKGWSRAKKEALIHGDFSRLRELSRCWSTQ